MLSFMRALPMPCPRYSGRTARESGDFQLSDLLFDLLHGCFYTGRGFAEHSWVEIEEDGTDFPSTSATRVCFQV